MEALQFQKAEFAANKSVCALCRAEIERTYFQLSGQVICEACGVKAQAGRQRPNNIWVLRGLLFGSGMAALCAAGYAIFTMETNMEVALIAVAIGYLVGKAVRAGSHGLGGRRCQILAVVLTYFAIMMGYLPPALKAMRESSHHADVQPADVQPTDVQPADVNANQPVADAEAPMPQNRNPSLSRRLIAVMVIAMGVVFVAVAAPVAILTTGASGILSVLILLLGLQQAWKVTARDSRLLVGPYELEEASTIA